MQRHGKIYSLLLLLLLTLNVSAQEMVGPVLYNPALKNNIEHPPLIQAKTTALSLPFFEDFTGYSPYPDTSKWADRHVYVNNTMGNKPISRGVATFDALNQFGRPYDTVNKVNLLTADSLTSKAIDLSGNIPDDSLYLSFFYQPQGNGFEPEVTDTLSLYFRRSNGSWKRVWYTPGTTLQPFTQVMVPVTDLSFFSADFQFRFVNMASINTNDDIWNIDYIRLDANRNINDTAVNEMAYTRNPSFILDDYTYMPYRQFLADINGERVTQHSTAIRNNYNFVQSVTHGYVARETTTGTPLTTNVGNVINVNPFTEETLGYSMYTNTVPLAGIYDRVVFENKYFINPVSVSDHRENDTIVHEQVFDNYLAYDDGTAEKSYFLNLSPTLPGKTAVEFHLNQPDTLRGVAIYFGRQVPMGSNKYFSAAVYSSISLGSNNDQVIYQEDFLFPAYKEVNNFWVYKFQNPVPLPQGTFYIGTIQPALSGSDSLYIGLDVNRSADNHLFVNLLWEWKASKVSGALMIRPMLGQPIFGTGVEEVAGKGSNEAAAELSWHVSPNPARERIELVSEGKKETCFEVVDMQGKVVAKSCCTKTTTVDISHLHPGMYIVKPSVDGRYYMPKKIVKLQ